MDYETRTWRGLRFAYTVRTGRKRGTEPSNYECWSLLPERTDCWARTPRRAVQLAACLPRVVLREPGLVVERLHGGVAYGPRWRMSCTDLDCFGTRPLLYGCMPSPRERWRYINAARARLPNPEARSELGWRAWSLHESVHWPKIDPLTFLDTAQEIQLEQPKRQLLLKSPYQSTIWREAELRVPTWSDCEAVRGVAGIHARRMPHNWRFAGWFADGHYEGPIPNANTVHGVVERFGRFVLGTKGWRAEWVVIRELEAPTQAIAEALRESYPEVKVHVKDVYEEDGQ